MSNGTILIVEDESRIRRMLKDYLTSCSYQILEAEDGGKAMELFYGENSRIDLVLLDVMMPVKDGFEVLNEIRDISQVPVIMLKRKVRNMISCLALSMVQMTMLQNHSLRCYCWHILRRF